MEIQVYTANTGNHDPERKEEDGLVVLTEDILKDPLLSARFYKCCPHILFPKIEWTIWIDANVFLLKSPEYFVNRVIESNKEYGLFKHFFRENAYEEIEAELEYPFEKDKASLIRTRDRYNLTGGSGFLAQNFIFIRKNTRENAVRNARWWMEICWGTKRDQVSLEIAYPGPYWPTFDFTKPNEYLIRKDGEFIK